MNITVERLRELINYDPQTGVFIHRIKRNGVLPSGIAGHINSHGRRKIRLEGRCYSASRLAWLYMTGEWPTLEVDHINCVKSDDRFCNLRLATRSENSANRKRLSTNTSGFKGVVLNNNKWRAQIEKNESHVHIGYFATAREAHEAYLAKAKELFGEFARAA